MSPRSLRLGVNIDHVATIRNARGGDHPDPVRAAEIVAAVGGDGITAHLREDRRHIRDSDLARIQAATGLPLNLEMAATEEMLAIALAHKPYAACIVPEKREERTTEGGLDAAGLHNRLAPMVSRLADEGIRVSLFIEADERQLEAAIRLRAPVVEFHTGEYAHAEGEARAIELRRIADMAALAAKNGIEPHAGHGLTFDNVQPIAAIPHLAELNIGHYLVGEAVFVGLEQAVRQMRELMDAALRGKEARVPALAAGWSALTVSFSICSVLIFALLLVGALSMGGDWRRGMLVGGLVVLIPLAILGVSTRRALDCWRNDKGISALRWHGLQSLAATCFVLPWVYVWIGP